MTRITALLLGAATAALIGSTLLRASSRPATAPRQQTEKPAVDPGAALFERMCSDCHELSRVSAIRRTRPDWEDIINKMIEKGASGTPKDFDAVFEYLVRTYGKVLVNTAKADEIAAVLGLSAKDAQAIVDFRTANGKFADFDAVRKVPNIDVKKLDEHKDAIAF